MNSIGLAAATFVFIWFLVCVGGDAAAQIAGCTDPVAINYNAGAIENDGSCLYEDFPVTPAWSIVVSDTLAETSGLLFLENRIWSHNDNTDPNLYELDTVTGNIESTCVLTGMQNVDWEEVTQDSDFVYIGDFGNNASGNRTDLRIYRIAKNNLCANAVVDTISFSYEDQLDFSPTGSNNTNFDCEAFIASGDSLFLFTKRWVDFQTSVYALPKTPGNHTAAHRVTHDVQGLVTGAAFLPDERLIVLTGYGALPQPFVFLLYDFTGSDFFAANKRRVMLDLPISQIEAVAARSATHFFISNEATPIFNTPQSLHGLNLAPQLEPYLNVRTLEAPQLLESFPNPGSGVFMLRGMSDGNCTVTVSDALGRTIQRESKTATNGKIEIDLTTQADGFYTVNVLHPRRAFSPAKIVVAR